MMSLKDKSAVVTGGSRGVTPMPRYPATKIPPSCENISIDLAKRVLTEAWGNVSKRPTRWAFRAVIFASWFERHLC